MQEPDESLIASGLGGDQAAYRELLARHKKAIFQIIFRIVKNRDETEDLTQDTFMRAFNSLATYRTEYRFSTWLYRIAANCAIDHLRKKRIEALSLDKPVETKDGSVGLEVADNSRNPEERLWAKRKTISISKAIESLPEKYRQVILYRHRDDQSYEEIAQILGLPIGTVKARIFRARELLKKKLKGIR
ncbi:MAG: sigma-70 family RNA polymerase sigma factor [candidate division Zixibacteria bacterium]|nr:sigma-70 family RNA polymerase sigma factor [candidate division Zixibacteria bacterium]